MSIVKRYIVAVAYEVPDRKPLAWVDSVDSLNAEGARQTAIDGIMAEADMDGTPVTIHDVDVMAAQ